MYYLHNKNINVIRFFVSWHLAGKRNMAVVSQGVKRKRRPKNICPNPMFVKWLEEWRDEALENGWKTSYTYSKVCTSCHDNCFWTLVMDNIIYIGIVINETLSIAH